MDKPTELDSRPQSILVSEELKDHVDMDPRQGTMPIFLSR